MKEELLALLEPYGQQHLLAFWDQLDAPQQASLSAQIRAIDFGLMERLYQARDARDDLRPLLERAGPPPAFRLDATQNPFTPEQARRRGSEALAAGQVGVILVAGGQGTRLGFDHPKGMFPIGPVSQKTLFQMHVEKVLARARRHGARIPLYVMTSPATHEETAAFFTAHDRFGLPADEFHIFCQGTMPAVDAATGHVLLESPDRIATSPDGHGGLLDAIARSGALDDLERRGIRHLFYLQVDNSLVDICGPEFVGYHLLAGSEFSSQVVAKRDVFEPLGNVIEADGKLMVIEYTDLRKALPDEAAVEAVVPRNADGLLAIWAGSIAVHVIETALLRRLSGSGGGLPFHVAHKKVACVDSSGHRVEPTDPNAIKFERFIFDLIPRARNAIVVEVDRGSAFAPLKNATGKKEDTPESARGLLTALHRAWLRQAGAEVADDLPVEISPLFALDAEELAANLPRGMRVAEPTYFA